jgi:general secretion pathway protein F
VRRFRYRALAGASDIVAGELDAPSRVQAARMLRARSLDPLRIEEGSGSRLWELLNTDVSIGRGRRLRQRRDFAQDLAALRAAGAPLDQALAILAEGGDPCALLARRVAERTAAGAALSAALGAEPRLFDEPSVALVAAGEASGELAQALQTLAEMTELSLATRSEMLRSLTYPAALIAASLLAVALMVFHVLPSFERLFEGAGAAMPPSAQFVFDAGRLARELALPLAAALMAGAAAAGFARSTDWGRQAIDRAVLRLPVVGRLLCALDLGRALLVAGRLAAAGATADRAFELAGGTCSNAVLRHELRAAGERIREGASVAAALAPARFMSRRAVRMVAIGEASGALPRMLGEVSRMQLDAARAGIKALLGALPPCLTVLIGALVAGLIYSVLTALLSINELAL